MTAASIRSKNPGAMWPGHIATKWGSTHYETLNDGTGQGNKIAYFDTYVQGICAQLDMWRTSALYHNKRFADAIAIWSGHNHVESYVQYVLQRVPGMTRDTVMDDNFWNSHLAIGFLKAQAGHEAGVANYPAPDEDWLKAQQIVMGVETPSKTWIDEVIDFQNQHHLKPDGRIGPQTWAKIKELLPKEVA